MIDGKFAGNIGFPMVSNSHLRSFGFEQNNEQTQQSMCATQCLICKCV